MHRRQAARAGAAQQPQQKRLGLVVARMPEGHEVRVELLPGVFKKLVPRLSRRVLERAPLDSSARPDVLPARRERHTEGTRHRRRKVFVALRLVVAELMVEMRSRGQLHFAGGVELAQDQREGD